MICAKCKNTPLHRLRVVGSLGAWDCQKCGGIWVPSGRAIGAQAPRELHEQTGGRAEQDTRAGMCPEGHGILIRAQTHLEEGFFLERCATCHGVWFDKGEWQRVSAAGLAGGLFEIWTEPWQRAQWQKKADASYLAQLEAELGAELVAQISELATRLKNHPSRSLAMAYFFRQFSEE